MNRSGHFLVFLCLFGVAVAYQRYDGWYNNLANPSWGRVGDSIDHIPVPSFADMTYQISLDKTPNPRVLSEDIFSGPSGLPSYKNSTVLFAFFGQMVADEIVHASDSACPVEQIRVPFLQQDEEFKIERGYETFLPFTRSEYMEGTGQSPGNPRKPKNKATSWIDGNFIYGQTEVWCNCLRSFQGGKLKTQNFTWEYPGSNKIGLPLQNTPNPATKSNIRLEDMWMFGGAHSHQNPGLAAMSIIWFRYHNIIAERVQQQNPTWTDHKIFNRARSLVIATLQNTIFYEWLPAFLGTHVPHYTGYQRQVKPTMTTIFEAAAFRFGHSVIPPGIYIRNQQCNFSSTEHGPALRLCNTYWLSQEIVEQYGVEDIILGMASQIAEREDHVIVNDLRGKVFGPLHFSRHDLCVLSLMRGKDHGLPDFNTIREAWNLQRITQWRDLNPELYDSNPELFEKLRMVYNDSLDHLDAYVAGMVESSSTGPGELFRTAILDQFTRIRDGDRFWFENDKHPSLNDNDREAIRKVKFRDVILAVTNLREVDLQSDVFFWRDGDPCPQPKQLECEDMTPCTPHTGYDYFSGSEIPYIVSFTCLALIPLLCILLAYALAACRNSKFKLGLLLRLKSPTVESFEPGDSVHVDEWQDTSKPTTPVCVSFDADRNVMVVNSRRVVRKIHLKNDETLNVWTATSRHKAMMRIQIPREPDLVLSSSRAKIQILVQKLRKFSQENNAEFIVSHTTIDHIMEQALTKTKRKKYLSEFIKNALLRVRTTEECGTSFENVDFGSCCNLANLTMSRDEFAEAFDMKVDSGFVDRMFRVIDKNQDGTIAFHDLFCTLLRLTQGSKEDKLFLIFQMYDMDKSGTLSPTEVNQMIKSLVDSTNPNQQENIDGMLSDMYLAAGLERTDSLKFKDFQTLLKDSVDLLDGVSLNCSDVGSHKKKLKSPEGQTSMKELVQFQKTFVKTDAPVSDKTLPRFTRRIQRYLENYRQHIVYLFLFFAITTLIFSERFYFYAVEQEHVGLRSIAGYGVSLTRGSAAVISFTFSLLLLTMCRNTITMLRATVFNLYVPFDSQVAFHKVVAYTALLFTFLHVVGYCFNFYHVATQPTQSLCVFEELYFRSDFIPGIDFWLFLNITGNTGVILTVLICILYTFASSVFRTRIFNAFWWTHQLVYLIYFLIILHGASRIIQDPYFHYYFIGPAMIYAIDKTISLSRNKIELDIIRTENLPSNIISIEFKRPRYFTYASGQWIRLACIPLGKDEYHPFTLTSAPHEENLMIHVRAVGPWTQHLKDLLTPDKWREECYPKVYLDGPFGAGQQDWYKYDISVLIGGGIGVTPYASILKDFVFMTSAHSSYKLKCKKVYFIWVTNSHKNFEWFLEILSQVEEVDKQGMVETHIFITQLVKSFDLRTTMMYIFEERFQKVARRSGFTGLKAHTHFGRPNFELILQAVAMKHRGLRRAGVFSCGPPGLTKHIRAACTATSVQSKTQFEHHYENF